MRYRARLNQRGSCVTVSRSSGRRDVRNEPPQSTREKRRDTALRKEEGRERGREGGREIKREKKRHILNMSSHTRERERERETKRVRERERERENTCGRHCDVCFE